MRHLNNGFTLAEILIAMAIFVSVALVITKFMLDLSNFSVFFGEDLMAEHPM